jgi:hypothetical protein
MGGAEVSKQKMSYPSRLPKTRREPFDKFWLGAGHQVLGSQSKGRQECQHWQDKNLLAIR